MKPPPENPGRFISFIGLYDLTSDYESKGRTFESFRARLFLMA